MMMKKQQTLVQEATRELTQAEIDAAKARQLVAPGKFTAFLTYFYAFLVMAVMYGAQQYTKAFGLAYCGLSEMQAASMTTMYQVGSIVAVAFWAVMMSKLKWHPLKVLSLMQVITAGFTFSSTFSTSGSNRLYRNLNSWIWLCRRCFTDRSFCITGIRTWTKRT